MTTPPPPSNNNASDPLNVLGGAHPTTFVKVQGTSRDDMNGLLGLAVQFNRERGRYMVQMTNGSSVMAFKPENLVKASMLEQYQGQFALLKNDPRVKQEVSKYYNKLQEFLPAGVKPEHVGMGFLAVLVMLVYLMGFTRVLMLISLITMIAMIVWRDVATYGLSNHRAILSNIPRRCNELLDQSLPTSLQGKLSNNMAAAIMIGLMLFSARAIFLPTAPKAAPAVPTPRSIPSSTTNSLSIEAAYKLGFDDAKAAKDFGASLPLQTVEDTAPSTARSLYDNAEFDGDFLTESAPTPSGNKFGLSQGMAIFYLYRTYNELMMGQPFSLELFKARLQTMDTWKYGLLGFSLYNLLKVFF